MAAQFILFLAFTLSCTANAFLQPQTTLVQCLQVTCPPVNCTRPLVRVKGECCDICIEITPPPGTDCDLILSRANLFIFRTSTVSTAPRTDGANNCEVDGVLYSDGDVFHPNTISNGTNSNPFCMSCRCMVSSKQLS